MSNDGIPIEDFVNRLNNFARDLEQTMSGTEPAKVESEITFKNVVAKLYLNKNFKEPAIQVAKDLGFKVKDGQIIIKAKASTPDEMITKLQNKAATFISLVKQIGKK